jgi:hypothetical protein
MAPKSEFKDFAETLVEILLAFQKQLDTHARALDAFDSAVRLLAREAGVDVPPGDPAPPISPGTISEIEELRKMWGADREPK